MSKAGSIKLGTSTIVKVHELDLMGFTAHDLLPGFDPDLLSRHPEWMNREVYDSDTGIVPLSVHTWLVEHNGNTLLIDTGAGNHKSRPQLKVLDDLDNPYLERLAACGMQPEDIDYVLLTHLHADHVGWNTRLVDQAWIPTFPNATVICSDREWRYGTVLAQEDEDTVAAIRKEAGLGESHRAPTPGVFSDSMAPIEAAGCLRRIQVDGSEVLEGVRFLPCAGHSIDHAAISISSQGEEAVFGGDMVHHPFELFMPGLTSVFCEFPDAARSSRMRVAGEIAERGAIYCSSHFPASSVGKITRQGAAFGWQFL